jgi:hypothetical protein
MVTYPTYPNADWREKHAAASHNREAAMGQIEAQIASKERELEHLKRQRDALAIGPIEASERGNGIRAVGHQV